MLGSHNRVCATHFFLLKKLLFDIHINNCILFQAG